MLRGQAIRRPESLLALGSSRLWLEPDPAECLAAFDVGVGGGGLGQRENAVDDDPQHPRGDVVQEAGDDGVWALSGDESGAREVAGQALVAGPQPGDFHRRAVLPAGAAEAHAAPALGQAAEACHQGLAAHRVEDHIGTQ